MNLKGAELRSFYEMTTLIPKGAIDLFNRNKECPGNANSQCTQNEFTDEKVGVYQQKSFLRKGNSYC
jgi:hypothetical protein